LWRAQLLAASLQSIIDCARFAGWRKEAEAVLEGLMAADGAWLFSEPVPQDVPLYYEIVAHPTDLGTISRRLKSGEFCDASRVFLEVQQVNFLDPGVNQTADTAASFSPALPQTPEQSH
jgi:hypothetical protein